MKNRRVPLLSAFVSWRVYNRPQIACKPLNWTGDWTTPSHRDRTWPWHSLFYSKRFRVFVGFGNVFFLGRGAHSSTVFARNGDEAHESSTRCLRLRLRLLSWVFSLSLSFSLLHKVFKCNVQISCGKSDTEIKYKQSEKQREKQVHILIHN